MDLFESGRLAEGAREAPLAYRMRPKNLDEFVGQEAIVGPGRLLRRAIEADRLSSAVFYGPPGCGKTALAEIIAGATKAHFRRLNAVTSGVSDLKKVIGEAGENLNLYRERTVLFIDEIHRFNKAQQDALLPAVEDGTLILVGATTENPYFEVNSPLLSRSRIFRFEPLKPQEVRTILQRAIADEERGLGNLNLEVSEEAIAHLVDVAGGDARSALNALELAALTTPPSEDGVIRVGLSEAEESIQRRAVLYDKDGDAHYDTISAFIKSLRGSDPDAALYWLARMLEAGEDPLFIARRMVIAAAEDVGLADPGALVQAVSAALALERVGLPEGRIPLAQAAVYLATAPKSNRSYIGLKKAMREVREKPFPGVPAHLRDSSYRGARELGHGKGYRYPHDYEGGHVRQRYLPEDVEGGYYRPSGRGYEERILAYLESIGYLAGDGEGV